MSTEQMLQQKVWAVIGANQDPKKYGNRIYRRLKSKRYEVYPVNPSCDTVEGDHCFPNLAALPKVPEVLNMVIAPKHGKQVLEEASRLGVKYVWLQPGTYDDELMALIEQLGIEAVQACVLQKTHEI